MSDARRTPPNNSIRSSPGVPGVSRTGPKRPIPSVGSSATPEFARTNSKPFSPPRLQFDRLVTPFPKQFPRHRAGSGQWRHCDPRTGGSHRRRLAPAAPRGLRLAVGTRSGAEWGSSTSLPASGSLNRLVAIKMIRSAEWATRKSGMRFRWEAETVAALDHPNIVPIYEVGEVVSEGARLPFFSMKLIEGENLLQARERLRDDWKSIARLMGLITRAVEHAHQRGVLHRDLKPANVLLGISTAAVSNEERQRGSGFLLDTSFVTPHISDFGLARRVHHQRGGTLPGAIIGTPSYLAPELTRGHELATSASDVYSLGAILYELLTGVPPFQGATPLETIQLVAGSAVKAPRTINPAVPPDLETICLKCLEADAEKRYPSADKLAEDLEHFLACRPIAARPIRSASSGSRAGASRQAPSLPGCRRAAGPGGTREPAAHHLELAPCGRTGAHRGGAPGRSATGTEPRRRTGAHRGESPDRSATGTGPGG